MTRGLQKAQAQKKNAAAQQDKKGTQKGEGVGKMGGAVRCPVCKISMPSYKVLQQHFDSKHPKDTLPPEDKCK